MQSKTKDKRQKINLPPRTLSPRRKIKHVSQSHKAAEKKFFLDFIKLNYTT